jgi:recombination protein RecA
MGKKKEKSDVDLFKEIVEETGGALFNETGNVKYVIDTGSLALNYICSGKFIGGGIAGGKITEVFGPESSAKSLVGYSILGGCQKAGGIGVYLDCEFAGNAGFAEKCGHLDSSKLITFWPQTFERLEKKVVVVVKAIRRSFGLDIPLLVVWDSIGVTMTERELRELDLPENATKTAIKEAGGQEKPGERAKAAGKILRKLNPFMDANNATFFIVNQTRANVGVCYGSEDVTAGGGRALRYYASCRLAFASSKQIKDEGRDVIIGVNLIMKNRKNRHFPPHLQTKGVQLFFNQGINPLGGLLSIFIGAERIKNSGKGAYKVLEPWAGGRDITFKASQERNDVPLDLLFQCPALVDATNQEEVKEYMKTYAPALDIGNSENLKEITTSEEELLDQILEQDTED